MILTSHRLWSFWEMLKEYPSGFAQLMSTLSTVQSALMVNPGGYGDKERGDIKRLIEMSRVLTHDLDLKFTELHLDRMAKEVTKATPAQIVESVETLMERIQDELDSRHFYFVPEALVKYYSTADLFGAAVAAKFPSAIGDIEDAGKCLALGRATSSVMHLMRVMECGLKLVGLQLGIPYAPSWEQYLTQIQTRVAEKRKKKTVKWKRDEKFYRDVSGDLLTVKQAWRNPTMHVERRYTPEEAEQIFKAVCSFMQRLADYEHLNAKPKTRKTRAVTA
jgi:hypothetical protein